MPPAVCRVCGAPAALKRPKTSTAMCKQCFFTAFETEVHQTIVDANLFTRGEKVAIGASGGKDSTVLAYVMKLLNERYDYGLELVLLSVDEGITGYRDDSLETVKRNQQQYDLPLKIVSYEELYGWTMDAIVKQIGLKNNCTFCGVFRRQSLDRGAFHVKADKVVTGHNADDVAETVLMNVLRGDIARLRRCTAITTGSEGTLPRCKPLKYAYEKEIVMYAYFKRLDYFSTECVYSPNAYRGYARSFLKNLEAVRPSAIIDIIHSGESLSIKQEVKMPVQGTCVQCGYISSNPVCKACVLLEGLNRGLPRLGIGKPHKARRLLADLHAGRQPHCRGQGSCTRAGPGDGSQGQGSAETDRACEERDSVGCRSPAEGQGSSSNRACCGQGSCARSDLEGGLAVGHSSADCGHTDSELDCRGQGSRTDHQSGGEIGQSDVDRGRSHSREQGHRGQTGDSKSDVAGGPSQTEKTAKLENVDSVVEGDMLNGMKQAEKHLDW